MERNLARRLRRADAKIWVAGLVSVFAIGLSLWRGPRLAKLISEQPAFESNPLASGISRRLKLEEIVWEEVGGSRLSGLVTRETLSRASGLKTGDEMLKLSLSEIERRLTAIPWVESVQIQKKLPSTLEVRYTVHQPKALGLRKNRVWLLSESGHWIAPMVPEAALDLPVVANEDNLSTELLWIDALRTRLMPYVTRVHEVGVSAVNGQKTTALVDIQFRSEKALVAIIGGFDPDPESLARLRRVLRYLVKNNIFVSTIDLRSGKKIVVNAGKRS